MARPILAVAAALTLMTAFPAGARTSLREDAHINDRLIAAQIGDYIRRACPSISPRLIYAFSEMKKLESYARRLGYSDAEIKAFINDPEEKRRVRVAAWTYMTSKGVVEGDRESYCRLGRAEIAAGTITGSLLYSH